MVGAISGVNSYFPVYGSYQMPLNAARNTGEAAQAAQRGQQAAVWTARQTASPETPVQPVAPVRPVDGDASQPVRLGPVLREGADPAEMAVRMRIKPYEEGAPEGAKSPDGNELKVGAGGAQAGGTEITGPVRRHGRLLPNAYQDRAGAGRLRRAGSRK